MNIIYTAGVIEDNKILLEIIPQIYDNVYAHHMTIQYGFDDDNLPDYVGDIFIFSANKLFMDDNAIALTGTINNSNIERIMQQNNQHAHITLATTNGTKPVYSNKLIQTDYFEKISPIQIKMKAEAFVVLDNGRKTWIF